VAAVNFYGGLPIGDGHFAQIQPANVHIEVEIVKRQIDCGGFRVGSNRGSGGRGCSGAGAGFEAAAALDLPLKIS